MVFLCVIEQNKRIVSKVQGKMSKNLRGSIVTCSQFIYKLKKKVRKICQLHVNDNLVCFFLVMVVAF